MSNFYLLVNNKKRGQFIKIKKALQQRPKGLELASSPYWTRSELLREILQ